MRLDKYLKVSRLRKRRTGRTARASLEIKPGDVIELTLGQRKTKVEVVSVAENARKDDAPAMYKEV